MKITVEWLKKKGACEEGKEWWAKKSESDVFKVIKALKKEKQYHWANWLLSRTFTKPQAVEYAIFAAEQVIDIFEKKYPDDKKPRLAIEAAKTWLKEPTEANRKAAADAYADAYAYDADAAAYAAYAAADAYDAAAAYDAYAYAAYAAYAAAAYAAAEKEKIQLKIIDFGVSILKREKK
jgi:hypothetical protein